MYKRYMNSIAILVVLLISLISISSAAGPRAMPDLYIGQCGVVLTVPAPGILANDIKSTGSLQVMGPGTITIDPKYGTLVVNADGSFVYNAAQNIPSGTYVYFYYAATDGTTVTNRALVKIAVSCKCKGAAPDIDVCLGTAITPDFLMSQGAGCIGCRDATPKFDLSKIPAQPVAGQCYPYTVTCPGCAVVTGHVCFRGPCDVSWNPFTICSGVTPTSVQILSQGEVTCSCDAAPVISDIHLVGDHWEYTITCQSECGPKTVVGRVDIETPCVPTFEPFTVCSGTPLTVEMIEADGLVSCGDCDATPVISDIHLVDDHWEYTITCTTALGCTATATGRVDIETPCVPTSVAFTVCPDVTPTADQILDSGVVSCGACDATPVISGIHIDGDHWVYTITCTTDLGCIATGTGIVNIGQPCDISFLVFSIPTINCPGNVLPTVEQIMDLGAVDCGCDATPVISNIHWTSTPPGEEWTGEYTITCTSTDGCTSSTTGTFNNAGCQEGCTCAPTAPNMCGCEDTPFPTALFEALGGGCHRSAGCDITPDYTIDDHLVDYSNPGHVYPYTVICEGCTGTSVANGQIYIRTLLCNPDGTSCTCPTHCP